MGAELFHADRRTNTTKLTVVFRNFSNAPKDGPTHTDNFPITSRMTSTSVSPVRLAPPVNNRPIY